MWKILLKSWLRQNKMTEFGSQKFHRHSEWKTYHSRLIRCSEENSQILFFVKFNSHLNFFRIQSFEENSLVCGVQVLHDSAFLNNSLEKRPIMNSPEKDEVKYQISKFFSLIGFYCANIPYLDWILAS